jgi:hypothetical protein
MNYSKPEVLELGKAARVIEGNKSGGTDGTHPQGTPGSELDD